MLGRFRISSRGLLLGLSACVFGAACGTSSPDSTFGDPSGGDGGTGDGNTLPFGGDADLGIGDGALGDAVQGFDVEPSALQTLVVTAGQTTPTVTFSALVNGQPVNAGWSIDRGELGTIAQGPASTGTFVPSGKVGGTVNVLAGWNGQTVTRQVAVKLVATQNGATADEQGQVATTVPSLTAGGGIGGVGGEGLGTNVTDPGTLGALQTPGSDGSAQGLTFLYPYDGTVWPRGLLAPLLQWNSSLGDVDAVQIQLSSTSGAFSWTGTFAKPAILSQTGGKFVRHPIPQDVWDMAVNSAGGKDKLTVGLTVAKGGQGYGPIKETWTVATGRLSGIIYYNSYGTQLAHNYSGAVGGNHQFGGAVLSIHVGDTGPKLAAGSDGGTAQCRVCHSVAGQGSRLVVQHGDTTSTSSAYDLSPSGTNTEHVLANGATFPALTPDGSKMLSASGQLWALPADPSPLPVSGLSAVTTNVGTPMFSADGKLVAFNPMAGPIAGATQKLTVMSYDDATGAFSNLATVVDDTGKPAATRPGWAAFLPDGKSLVYHHQSVAGADGNGAGAMYTRKGAKAQIHWAQLAGTNSGDTLNQLNGKGPSGTTYLPKLATPISMSCTGDGVQVGNIDPDHGDDVDVNYEPTVNPRGAGGYAWVVFTSRRMYGSVANIPPFCSDPRGVDLIQNITPKKLWVAAVDLNAAPGADPSHPAFYLPAQELLAGNSRAFWVLDPCRQDGTSCQTGDQCCNGYCEANGDGGALICSNTLPNAACAKEGEKCATSGECCDTSLSCIGGFCTQAIPR